MLNGIIAVLLPLIFAFFVIRLQRKNPSYPPRAPKGCLETIKLVSGSDFPWWVLRTAQELKSHIFRLSLPIFGTPMVVVVGELETAHQILTDPLSQKPLALYSSFNCLNGRGVSTMFTSNGKSWHSKRKAVAPSFSSNHIHRMNSVALEKIEVWINEKLHPMIQEGKSFDVANEMIGITLSAICATAFEYEMSEEEKCSFLSELELGLKEFAFKSSLNPFRRLFGLFIPERCRAFQSANKLRLIARRVIDSYRNLETPLQGTIVDRIMTSDAYGNDDERAAEILGFLIAGYDTTGYSLAWILLDLARNPAELRRLRETLSGVSPEDWSRSDVLKDVIKEGMRLHPVASGGSIRVIGRDIMTSEKLLIPNGSIVFLPLILLFRNSDIYGDAHVFRPSRWQNATKEMLDSFMPFSFGKQNCIGQKLAKAEIHCIVARICSEFDLVVEDEGDVDYFLTLKPVGAHLKACKVDT